MSDYQPGRVYGSEDGYALTEAVAHQAVQASVPPRGCLTFRIAEPQTVA